MITDRRLQIFVKVVECGGFTAAAHSLKMSQPAVSQSVAQTEADAGVPLLERGPGKVSLTPAGERFLHYARRILSLYDNLNSELSGAPAFPETATLDLGDGRFASVSVIDGKIQIELEK